MSTSSNNKINSNNLTCPLCQQTFVLAYSFRIHSKKCQADPVSKVEKKKCQTIVSVQAVEKLDKNIQNEGPHNLDEKNITNEPAIPELEASLKQQEPPSKLNKDSENKVPKLKKVVHKLPPPSGKPISKMVAPPTISKMESATTKVSSSVEPINQPNIKNGGGGGGPAEVVIGKKIIEKRYSCPSCPYRTDHKGAHRVHLKRHSPSKPLKCPHCPFRTRDNLASHLRYIHPPPNQKWFNCPHPSCPYQGKTRQLLWIHSKSHTLDKPISCPYPNCDYTCRANGTLRSHVQVHHTTEKPYQCPFCPYKGRRGQSLSIHFQTHTGEKPLKCPSCPYTAARHGSLASHQMTHHTENRPRFPCGICGMELVSKKGLKNHLNAHKNIKPYSCNQCDYKSSHESTVSAHKAQVHSTQRPFKCPLCPYAAKIRRTLNEHHKKVHVGDRPFSCQFNSCDYRGASKTMVKRHEETHKVKTMAEKFFPCTLKSCPFRSDRKESVAVHMATVHSVEKKFKCDHPGCHYKCKMKFRLKGHFKIFHMDEKPYTCTSVKGCQFRTKFKGTLAVHERRHRGEKPFECKFCEYRAVSRAQLNGHLLGHTGERPYACKFGGGCKFVGRNNGALKSHMVVHTKERPYECKICGARFAQSNSRKGHLRIHTGEKPFRCQFQNCTYASTTGSTLKVHTRRIHTREKPYKCTVEGCLFSAFVRSALSTHERREHAQPNPEHKFVCSWQPDGCSRRFPDQKKLNRHINLKHKDKPWPCSWPGCGHRTMHKYNLKLHYKIMHALAVTTVPTTTTTTTTTTKKKREMAVEARRKIAVEKKISRKKCQTCHFSTTRAKDLAIHSMEEHGMPKVFMRRFDD